MAARLPVPDVGDLKLKSRPADFSLLGKFVPGVDNKKILTGQPLLYAVYAKCPVFEGKVRNANVDEIRSLPGVTHAFVVEGTDDLRGLRSGVAIVAETWWQADSARKSLRVDWDTNQSDSSADYEKRAEELRAEQGETLGFAGDVDEAMGNASQIVEAGYYYPFVSHANMEPQNCTALFKESGELEFWAPTQNPKGARQLVAKTLGIATDKIHINLMRIGGGFGRRLRNEFMAEVAWIAREVRRPVQLQWTREDDMQHDYYRPGAWHDFKAGLDDDGRMNDRVRSPLHYLWRQRRNRQRSEPVSESLPCRTGSEFPPAAIPGRYQCADRPLAFAGPFGVWLGVPVFLRRSGTGCGS
jgi:isoquinoline 1-oxidoreductase beta subunit